VNDQKPVLSTELLILVSNSFQLGDPNIFEAAGAQQRLVWAADGVAAISDVPGIPVDLHGTRPNLLLVLH